MRISRLGILTAIVGATVLVAGCAATAPADPDAASDPVVLKVAAVTSPMTDVVEAAGEVIGDGYEIELVEVSDYITANTIVNDGDAYANFSQHEPYMQEFNAANDGSLVAVQPVYNFVIAFYSKTLDDIGDLPEGATVAVPNDSSNLGRALKLLDAEGVITLDEAVDPYAATVGDIVENPKGVEFLEVPIASLNAAYEEADLVFQWPSHIAALGLTPDRDGLIAELDDRFVLNVAVREEDVDSDATEALKTAFASGEVRQVIESNGTIEPAF
ncbi:D-methionine transport system substrate-binding protein [Microbacterium ginsengiterrae]|uniref:D-methionine transport system substrate-binding protein n=1 Tax=Microbacterium ginsengiterrae TaxID=546115 RepID=A0A7W9CCH6_9MICO|nr:MetQ/NlpA family ABC transporter substrate-binding protein [Microbacterium ginsengiterrae]MBB5743071.1 D-methionine transport system substrate-binding protein [Microbacterium ginsengiterrae]